MTTTFAKITHRPEFLKDLKQLLKRFKTLEDDLENFHKTQLILYHKQQIENNGIVPINNLGIIKPKIFKAVKFACKALRGRGVASGIRLIYAYFEDQDEIEFIEIYFKADQENEDRNRIMRIYSPKGIELTV